MPEDVQHDEEEDVTQAELSLKQNCHSSRIARVFTLVPAKKCARVKKNCACLHAACTYKHVCTLHARVCALHARVRTLRARVRTQICTMRGG